MSTRLSVSIIGTGPGGLALGMLLARAGFRDFTIFDREDGVGGTWRINTSPGLACDVKSHLYSYSFDLNPDRSRLWSPQPEILAYFERCADECGLRPHLKLRTEIRSARWEDDTQQGFKPADFSFSGLPAEAASAVSLTARATRSR